MSRQRGRADIVEIQVESDHLNDERYEERYGMKHRNKPVVVNYGAARRIMAHEAEPPANVPAEVLKHLLIPGYTYYQIFKRAVPAARKFYHYLSD
jgi:hypothetical protein